LTYLGVVLNFNGKFSVAEKHVAEQGRKAVFALIKNTKPFMFNHHTLLSLFDTYISVLCYGCEIWGFHKAPDIEKVRVNYCKGILNVKTSTCTPNIMVYYELGRYPLIVTKKIRIFKFWLKLLNANNCILKGWYAFLYDMWLKNPNNMNNWVCNIGKELCNIGLIDLRNSQAMLSKNVIFLIKQRLFDMSSRNLMLH
jgi:hypothetical protein